MAEEKKSKAVLYIVIVIIALIVIFAIAGSSNQSNNNQAQGNQTAVETPAQSPQVAPQAPVKVPTQSLQSQCEAKAKKLFDYYVSVMQPRTQTQFGSDSIGNFSYSSHYNKSMGACIQSIHEDGFSNQYNIYYDYYWLFNADDAVNSFIGTLSYGTKGTTKTVTQCMVNSSPCTSIDQYTSMTAPYLNN